MVGYVIRILALTVVVMSLLKINVARAQAGRGQSADRTVSKQSVHPTPPYHKSAAYKGIDPRHPGGVLLLEFRKEDTTQNWVFEKMQQRITLGLQSVGTPAEKLAALPCLDFN